jgi:hypothetical protein
LETVPWDAEKNMYSYPAAKHTQQGGHSRGQAILGPWTWRFCLQRNPQVMELALHHRVWGYQPPCPLQLMLPMPEPHSVPTTTYHPSMTGHMVAGCPQAPQLVIVACPQVSRDPSQDSPGPWHSEIGRPCSGLLQRWPL